MKKLTFSSALVLLTLFLSAQDYTWMRGSNTSGATGNYGSLGMPSSGNDPGGRHGCAKWVDASGNLWLFGGEGYSTTNTLGWLNDLWKYNPTTNQWTWIRGFNGLNTTGAYGTLGVASLLNEPGAREFPACWTDASGNFWMFGGDGFASNSTFGRLGDLWKYNPTTNQWTWMSGFNTVMQNGIYSPLGVSTPTGMPGCRYGAGTWTDNSGNFWLFGGRGLAASGPQGYLNDLWKYSPSTNQWTWITGTNLTNQYGLYGTLSVPSSTNAPGTRYFPACWTDASNNLYMFGGLGFALSATNSINDFWKYNPMANTWTWIGGSNGVSTLGIYGTLGVSSSTNMPGARFASAYWKDLSGNFWLFGGNGFSSVAGGELNDLFRYNPALNEWTWMKGSNLADQNGTYGVQGVSSASNTPGARTFNTWWNDQNGKPWIFGGEGYDASSSSANHMNDLWTFKIPCNPDSIQISSGNPVCSGSSVTLTGVNGGPSTSWFTSASGTVAIANGTVLSLTTLTAGTTPSVYSYYAEANSCTVQPRAQIQITVNPAPQLTATAIRTVICKGETTTLTATGANSYTWNTSPAQTASVIVVSPTTTVNYFVSGINNYNCTGTSSVTIKFNFCTGLYSSESAIFQHRLYPNPNNGTFTFEINENPETAILVINNVLGEKVSEHFFTENTCNVKTHLPSGIYYYQLKLKDHKGITGKFVIEN